jgi:hypothetical protein
MADGRRPVELGLREAFALALADLQRPTAIALQARYAIHGREVTVSVTGELGWATFSALDDHGGWLLRAVADWLQDYLSETRAGWGQARPACPGHPHPASAVLVDGTPLWCCPNDGRALGLIGSLASD